ncbi:MAG: 7-carboxy-7-deazaguanine synthase [Myxococcota bacterium]
MAFHIKEIFLTLQGEGFHAGRAAVFCRFTGCNLWNGREEDRATAACRFCDTDFNGTDGEQGGKYNEAELVSVLRSTWDSGIHSVGHPFVVFTGGEPTLQLTSALVIACQAVGFEVAIETNGTKAPPKEVDWVCVSPKPRAKLICTAGNELKLIYPQPEVEMAPSNFESLDFTHFYLQPMDDTNQALNVQRTAAYCMAHPRWRLSLQTHKLIGIP